MRKEATDILSLCFFAIALLDLAANHGYSKALSVLGAQFTIGELAVSGPNPYEKLFPFLICVAAFSCLAVGGVRVRHDRTARAIESACFLTIGGLYAVILIEKSSYANQSGDFLFMVRQTILLERIGLSITLIWVVSKLFQFAMRRRSKQIES